MQQESRPVAADLITARGQWVAPGSAVADAAQILLGSGLPMVPVCEPDGRLVGVVTVRAIISAVARGHASSGRLVDDVMDGSPVFVTDDASVEWILVEMDDAHTWSLPVTDAGHRLIGVVNLPDLTWVVFPGLLIRMWNGVFRRH